MNDNLWQSFSFLFAGHIASSATWYAGRYGHESYTDKLLALTMGAEISQ